MSATPDTGTSRSCIRLSVLQRANLRFNPYGKENITTANGTGLDCRGNVLLEIKVGPHKMVIDALVASNLHTECLISWDDLRRLGIISPSFPHVSYAQCNSVASLPAGLRPARIPILGAGFPSKPPDCTPRPGLPPKPPDTLESLIAEFSDVFDEEKVTPMTCEPMTIDMRRDDPGYKPVRVSSPRATPVRFADEAAKTLKWFLESGVISRVHPNESCEWTSPGFFVAKPNGKARLVVDYSGANKFITRPVHPFPSPRDIVRGIRPDSKCFAKIDCVQGYYQVPLDENSQKYTTFLLPQGRFRFLRAPMGLSPSSDAFCFRTDDILSPVEDLLKIVDDCLLQAANYPDLLRKLRVALECARRGHLTLSKPKLSMGSEISFAGYVFSDEGMKPDPRRLSAIRDFPAPTDLTSLRGFLGLANQLAFFLPDLAHCTESLRQLLKKDVSWIWLPDHEAAFRKTKAVLLSPLVVKPFDPALPTQLLTDASRLKGLGYALVQRLTPSSPMRLIQCGSRSLASAETRYATIELECLAIAWAIQDCRHYLFGGAFEVLTDHRPLVGIFDKMIGDIANGRLARIRMKLTDYSFNVTYVAGKTHYLADSLSRNPVFDPPECPEVPELLGGHTAYHVTPGDPVLAGMYASAQGDQKYSSIVEALLQGKDIKNLPPGHPAKQLANVWNCLSVKDDVLIILDGSRIVVPYSCRPSVLRQLHFSHSGIARTRAFARSLFFWPGITNDIKMMIEACAKCQRVRDSQPAEPEQKPSTPTFPMQCISLDLFYLAGKDYLITVDRYSGMTWVHLLDGQSTQSVLEPLQALLNEHGWVNQVISDNGPAFRGEFKRWCETNYIEHLPSSPYNPSSNGSAEVGVSNAKKLLEKSISLKEFYARLLHWRNVPSRDLHSTPAQLFFGRRQRCGLPVLAPMPLPPVRVPGMTELPIGTPVLLQNPLTKRWDETGQVTAQRQSGRSYIVKRAGGGIDFHRNRRFLKPIADQSRSLWQADRPQLGSQPPMPHPFQAAGKPSLPPPFPAAGQPSMPHPFPAAGDLSSMIPNPNLVIPRPSPGPTGSDSSTNSWSPRTSGRRTSPIVRFQAGTR